ncbi:MAG: hypothetical protein OXC37_05405 [Bdellovibrionaceae bacterium]|nr:hypothetical protein [Pseudobdellovibrionaceae bacterium]
MFLRFLILLFSVGFIASCDMSGSEEERQMEKQQQNNETAMTEGKLKVTVECECKREDRSPTVKGEGDTKQEATLDAIKKCPAKLVVKALSGGLTKQLGDCKQISR